MKVRFYIEKRNDENGRLLGSNRPVFMSISYAGIRTVLGTGIKVDLSAWDSENQRVKISDPESYPLNAWLNTLSDTAASALKAMNSQPDQYSAEGFREAFHQLVPRYSSGFFDVFYMFLEENSQRWSVSTYRKVRTIYKHLREFETSTGILLNFKRMDADFLEKFQAFYLEKGNSKTTTYKAINILVWFLNWATDQGYNVYRSYRTFYKRMGTATEPARTPLNLYWDELMKIKEFKTDNRRTERVRDLFCFMCFSGVRFSELQALKKEDITQNEMMIRKRNGNSRRLPLNRYAKEISSVYENKYYLNNAAFPSMSIITMNKYLRLIGKEVKLNRQVPNLRGEPGKIPLFDRLTAGMAVNTFVANAIELQIPVEIISRFTGVRNDSRVRRISRELAVQEMRKFEQR